MQPLLLNLSCLIPVSTSIGDCKLSESWANIKFLRAWWVKKRESKRHPWPIIAPPTIHIHIFCRKPSDHVLQQDPSRDPPKTQTPTPNSFDLRSTCASEPPTFDDHRLSDEKPPRAAGLFRLRLQKPSGDQCVFDV